MEPYNGFKVPGYTDLLLVLVFPGLVYNFKLLEVR